MNEVLGFPAIKVTTATLLVLHIIHYSTTYCDSDPWYLVDFRFTIRDPSVAQQTYSSIVYCRLFLGMVTTKYHITSMDAAPEQVCAC